jgi:restriction endonuclease S subunit
MTEFYAYNNNGKIPIYSGASNKNGIFRYTNRIDYNFDEYTTWSISGKAGTLYLRHGPCCLTRDCGIMVPKNKDEIILEWFILTQELNLKNFAIGRGGLGRLKKNIVSLFKFNLPKKPLQRKILFEYKKLIKIKEKIVCSINIFNKQLEKNIDC